MIVLKENERHHATSWQYNSARILTRLAQLITAQGGKVKPLYPAVISDRNLEEAYTATQRRIESSSTFHPKVREPLISNLQKELALFQAIPNAPITVTHTSYINFAMNGVYYSYSLDNNPFFPFHYLKTPIDPKSETYSGDACVEESSKSWFTDPRAPASPTLTIPATTLKISPSKSAASRLIFERQNAATPFITIQSAKERSN